MDNEKICQDCQQVITGEYYEYDGGYLCQGCHEENYFTCEDCDEICSNDNMYHIEDRDRYVCESCLDNYNYCEDCQTYNEGYTTIHRIDGSSYEVCDCCFDNGDYYFCEGCNQYYHIDDMHYVENEDRHVCDNCYEEMEENMDNNRIYNYHEFCDWQFFKSEKDTEKDYFIGKEIELEPTGEINNDKILEAISNINAVGMRDSSLRYGGVEVVTHPETWNYLQENKENYQKFFDRIKELNYKNCGGCGLHFHVSRPSDNVISRIIVLLESFKEEIKKLSRRRTSQLSQWAKFLTDNCTEESKINFQSTKYIKDKYIKGYQERYNALNLRNEKTIEFRFFNGANNFEEFWGDMQFIHNLMELALNEERELNKINWQDLLIGEELRNQAQKYGVFNIDKYAKDTTYILEKYENAMSKLKEDLKRVLNNMAKYVNNEISNLTLKDIKTNNLSQMSQKVEDFNRDFRYRTNYLQRIIDLHHALDTNNYVTFSNIKDYIRNTKASFPNNSKRYERYDKQIDKLISNFESEVK